MRIVSNRYDKTYGRLDAEDDLPEVSARPFGNRKTVYVCDDCHEYLITMPRK